MPDQPARSGERYGDPRPRGGRGLVAGVVVLATAFLGWVVWAALGAAAPDVRGEVTGFRVQSREAIRVRVAAAPGAPGPLACSVQALDRTREVVGVGEVRLDPASRADRERWLMGRTRDRAVTATVGDCSPT